MCLCSCMRLRLRLPLATAALVKRGTRTHANSNCQMPDGRTQESHAGRVLPRAGNNMLWKSKTDMGCVQNGIALSLSPSRSRSRSHTRSRTRTGARTIQTCLQPLCVPPPPATMPPQHIPAGARSTGEDDTGGLPGARAVGQSDNRRDLSPTWTQTAKTMLPCLANQMAPPDDFMSPGRITDSIAYHLSAGKCRLITTEQGLDRFGTQLDRSGEHRGEKGTEKEEMKGEGRVLLERDLPRVLTKPHRCYLIDSAAHIAAQVGVPRPMTHDKLEHNSPTPYTLVPAGGPQRVRAPAPSSSSSSSSSSLGPPPLPVISRPALATMAAHCPYHFLNGHEMSQQSGIKQKV